MTEAALRVALVLPLLLLTLGGVLVAARRGLIRLPGATLGAPPLRLVQVVALGPGARLAVAEFEGARLLIGAGKDGVRLLTSVPSLPASSLPAPSPPGAAGERGGPGWGGLSEGRVSGEDRVPPPQPSPLAVRFAHREGESRK